MPVSIATFDGLLVQQFDAKFRVAINARKTPPQIGTHLRANKHVNRNRSVQASVEFFLGLKDQETVAEMKSHLAQHLLLNGERLAPSRFVIYGPDNKVLHGGTGIIWRHPASTSSASRGCRQPQPSLPPRGSSGRAHLREPAMAAHRRRSAGR